MTFLPRVVSRAAAIVLLISATTVAMTVAAPGAFASGTVLFSQPFHDNTVDGPAGSVSLPAALSGTNAACLSAVGNATANPLASVGFGLGALGPCARTVRVPQVGRRRPRDRRLRRFRRISHAAAVRARMRRVTRMAARIR